MNKSAITTIFAAAALSLSKKVTGSKNNPLQWRSPHNDKEVYIMGWTTRPWYTGDDWGARPLPGFYLPEEIFEEDQWPPLEEIKIEYSKVKYIPREIINLKYLEIFEIRMALVDHIPQEIFQLPNIYTIVIDNPFYPLIYNPRAVDDGWNEGVVCSDGYIKNGKNGDARSKIDFSHISNPNPNISRLEIVGCGLNKFPDFIPQISGLNILEISNGYEPLTETIMESAFPEWICKLENLKYLRLHYKISSDEKYITIPDDLHKLKISNSVSFGFTSTTRYQPMFIKTEDMINLIKNDASPEIIREFINKYIEDDFKLEPSFVRELIQKGINPKTIQIILPYINTSVESKIRRF